MSDSLRDQLLGLGFKPSPKPENTAKSGQATGSRSERTHQHKHGDKPGRGAESSAQAPGARAPGAQGRRPDVAKPQGIERHQRVDAASKKPRSREEIDLAKAYAIRAQREKEERIEAERLKQEEARKRREAKAQFAELVKDKGLNDPNAEIARHFNYGGKIKRIYVNETQLKALNAGELGVVQLDGRYLLIDSGLLAQAEAIFAPAIALKVDPNAPAEDDPYADPQYQVPDDLVW